MKHGRKANKMVALNWNLAMFPADFFGNLDFFQLVGCAAYAR